MKTLIICITVFACVLSAYNPDTLKFIIDRFGVLIFFAALLWWMDKSNKPNKS